jgi:hypothetical protein
MPWSRPRAYMDPVIPEEAFAFVLAPYSPQALGMLIFSRDT